MGECALVAMANYQSVHHRFIFRCHQLSISRGEYLCKTSWIQGKWCQNNLDLTCPPFFGTLLSTKKKRFYLVQLTQMWVDGVGWTQTFINHCFYGIFDPFFPKTSCKFTVKITFGVPNLSFSGGHYAAIPGHVKVSIRELSQISISIIISDSNFHCKTLDKIVTTFQLLI